MTLPTEVYEAVVNHRMLFQTRKVSTSGMPLQLLALFFVQDNACHDSFTVVNRWVPRLERCH